MGKKVEQVSNPCFDAALKMYNDESFKSSMIGLYFRWQDEKEYEDFSEYVKFAKEKIEGFGFGFEKMTKRPYKVYFVVGDQGFYLHLTHNSYNLQRYK